MTRLGFIGLGIMGSGMAANLIEDGNELTVWNRTAEKARNIRGAKQAATALDVGPASDIVFVCVSDTADVKEVVFDDFGVIHGMTQMVKAVNQVLVVLNQLAASEALMLAQGAGLDLRKTLSAVEGGAAGS